MRLLRSTKSVCPECLRVLDAVIYKEDGKVWIKRTCPDHGECKEVYWADYEMYARAEKYSQVGRGVENPRTETKRNCPLDCGLCPQHRSHTVLAIIDVTNRCNLNCPICFASSSPPYVYEPTKEEIRGMLENLRMNQPVAPPALQFSGGEPTIREDFLELIQMAKELGFRHIEVNTNGLELARSADYCAELREAGASAVYLQFDGVTAEPYIKARGRDLLDLKIRAVENCRKAGLVVILVPTVAKGVNDDQLGEIIRFAARHRDVVRCVNFQPVSITGRIDYEKRNEMRITIPECIKLIEKQTGGQVRAEDFYPVPFVVPISRAVGALRGEEYVEFTAHPHCGMATYIFVEDGELVPITRYASVEKLLQAMQKVCRDAQAGQMLRAKLRLIGALRHVRWSLLRKLVWGILSRGSYEALAELHHKMIMIGMMHFMDLYNFDLERVQRCVIHYAIPDGRIIPFCTMNSIHRETIEKAFSMPFAEWRKRRRD